MSILQNKLYGFRGNSIVLVFQKCSILSRYLFYIEYILYQCILHSQTFFLKRTLKTKANNTHFKRHILDVWKIKICCEIFQIPSGQAKQPMQCYSVPLELKHTSLQAFEACTSAISLSIPFFKVIFLYAQLIERKKMWLNCSAVANELIPMFVYTLTTTYFTLGQPNV